MKTRLKQFVCLALVLVLAFALFTRFGGPVYIQADDIFIPQPTPAPIPGQHFELEHEDFFDVMDGIGPTPTPMPSQQFENVDSSDALSPTPPPAAGHIPNDSRFDSRPSVFMDDNPILNVLRHSESEAAQEIRDNLEIYLDDRFRPNQEWIAQHTSDLSPYGNFVMVHDPASGTTTAYNMNTIEPIMNFSLQNYDAFAKEILQVLNAPETAIPTLEEIQYSLDLEETPVILRPMPLPIDDGSGFDATPRSNAFFTRVLNTRNDPYYAIVMLEVTWSNGSRTGGSGFLINRNTVVTAGHMLFNRLRGGWATSVRVIPGRDGTSMPYGTYYSSGSFSVGASWFLNSDLNGDWGILRLLTQNVNVPSHFWMSGRTDSQLLNLPITATGFPNGVTPEHTMHRGRGVIIEVDQFRIVTGIHTTGGLSGAPVYDSFGWVVGIISTTVGGVSPPAEAIAVRLTSDLINFFNSW